MSRETRSFTARLDVAVLDRLRVESDRSGHSSSRLAERLIDEGLRMSEFPGVVFRPGPTGRRAVLIDGPDVWEVIGELRRAVAEEIAEPIAATAAALGLEVGHVELAAGYHGAFPDEIDERLEAQAAATERVRRALAVPPAG